MAANVAEQQSTHELLLAQLSVGLEAGHRELNDSLQELLRATATPDCAVDGIQRKSEQQLALYLKFLARATEISAELAKPPQAPPQPEPPSLLATPLRLLCCLRAPRIAPPMPPPETGAVDVAVVTPRT